MNKTLLSILLLLLLSFTQASVADQTFGTGANMDTTVSISQILSSPANYLSAPVTVEGTIIKVCQKRGCWAELASDKKYQSLRMKVRDGDMVFPLTAIGKTAYATGMLSAKELDVEQTKRYLAYQAQEANQSFDEASVTAGMTVYQLTPHGVTIKE